MNQKNNRKWMAGALLLTAGLCFVPGKTVSARMEVNSYGELTGVHRFAGSNDSRKYFFHRK